MANEDTTAARLTRLLLLSVLLTSASIWGYFLYEAYRTDSIYESSGRIKAYDLRQHYLAAPIYDEPEALFISSYIYPPPVAWASSFLAGWSYHSLYLAWNGLSILMAISTLLLLLRFFELKNTVFLWIFGCTFPYIFHCIWVGQNSCLSVLILVSAAVCLRVQIPWATGIILGCLFYKPQLCGLCFLSLLALRQYQASGFLLLTGSMWMLLGTLACGIDVLLCWFELVLSEPDHVYSNRLNTTWKGLFMSLPAIGIEGIPIKLHFLPTLACLGAAWWFAQRIQRTPEEIFLIIVPVSSVATAYSASYDMTILFPLLALLQQDIFHRPKLLWLLGFIQIFGFINITARMHGFSFGAIPVTLWLLGIWWVFYQVSQEKPSGPQSSIPAQT